MIYTELFKYKHKVHGWIARNNGKIGNDVFEYYDTIINQYIFTKEEYLATSTDWKQLKYNDKE